MNGGPNVHIWPQLFFWSRFGPIYRETFRKKYEKIGFEDKNDNF